MQETDLAQLGKIFLKRGRDGSVEQNQHAFEPPVITLGELLEQGKRLQYEQEMINRLKLAPEYLKMQKGGGSIIGMQG